MYGKSVAEWLQKFEQKLNETESLLSSLRQEFEDLRRSLPKED